MGVGDAIWPHGRWRVDLPGEANHAGTTALNDRRDPMIALAALIQQARAAADRHTALATCGKVRVAPNAVNAVPAHVTAWIDARADSEARVQAAIEELRGFAAAAGGEFIEESWTATTSFTESLVTALATQLRAPVLSTGAGHDAGMLATAGMPRRCSSCATPPGCRIHRPSSPTEADCLVGVDALAAALRELT